MTNEIESLGDFNTQWIFAQYEAGKAVSEIAAGMKVCESAVYARMRMRPKTYEEVKKVREEMYCRRLRRVRGLADAIALDYLERQYAKRANAETDAEKEALDATIGEVLKIGKQYGDRVQLAEGKATANVGNANGLPFQITVTKTYEQTAISDQLPDEGAE